MTAERSAIRWVVLLTIVWGTNWPLFKYATAEVSVWTFRAISVTGAGITVLAIAKLSGLSLQVPRAHWGHLIRTALVYLFVWNVCSTFAAVMIPSGQAAVLGYTMPIWVVLIGWIVLGKGLKSNEMLAVSLGTAGIGLLIYRGLHGYLDQPIGFLLGVTAGLGWAIGSVMLKSRPIPVDPKVLTGWQLIIVGVPIVIIAFWQGDGVWFMPTWQSSLTIAYITLVPLTLGNVAWFMIMKILPTHKAGFAAALVPVVAMISGAIVHGEPLGPIEIGATALCCAGLVLLMLNPFGQNR